MGLLTRAAKVAGRAAARPSCGSNVWKIGTGPQGALLHGDPRAAVSAGVATCDDVLLDTAGQYTLTATVSGLSSGTSTSFTVSATAASQLAFSPQLSGHPSPTQTVITVDVEDSTAWV